MSATPRQPKIPGVLYEAERKCNIFEITCAYIAIGLIYGVWFGIPYFSAILILWFIGQ
jgi:asparagine N-glycosylation enzyme membrane subunit Stt3